MRKAQNNILTTRAKASLIELLEVERGKLKHKIAENSVFNIEFNSSSSSRLNSLNVLWVRKNGTKTWENAIVI